MIWDKIDDAFREKLENALASCRDQGFNLVPYLGYRTLLQQNKLYRQSRPLSIIQNKIAELKAAGAPYLASQLEACPPCNAGYVTNAVGGLSWHNWGRAMDCYVSVNKKAIWDSSHPGYAAYGEALLNEGLKWGGSFRSLPDYGHAQLDQKEPLDLYSYSEIDQHFQSQVEG